MVIVNLRALKHTPALDWGHRKLLEQSGPVRRMWVRKQLKGNWSR
jgi:hypothetical protein